ncbi:uncharacterized protein LOC124939301 [Impatiens glandulifera]|uniref:uncharacterized protein LOC124939301 n=1 Tax=Impatiens glandulifera TaxID=253017 RepID=UPI001FB0CFB1|nr:uncharacterized protein LOC124939301 [Impatiens glandulifera]
MGGVIKCDLRIIRAKNVEMKSEGQLFVRCFLPAGNNRRVRIDTREILLGSSPLVWDQFFSLECHDNNFIMNETMLIVVELRWRSVVPVIGKLRGSQLLGRAEIPWDNIMMDSPKIMKIEKWLVMKSSGGAKHGHDVKTPAVEISLMVTLPAINCLIGDVESRRKRRRRNRMVSGEEHCGCNSNSLSYEVLTMAAALEVL